MFPQAVCKMSKVYSTFNNYLKISTSTEIPIVCTRISYHIFGFLFGMHTPRRCFIIKCKPNVNCCTTSMWVSILIYFSSIFLFIYFVIYLINYILLYNRVFAVEPLHDIHRTGYHDRRHHLLHG